MTIIVCGGDGPQDPRCSDFTPCTTDDQLAQLERQRELRERYGDPVEEQAEEPLAELRTAVPSAGMVNVDVVPWTTAAPGPDPRTVVITWESGEPCYLLDHVTVAEDAESVMVWLHEGVDPAAKGATCGGGTTTRTVEVPLAEPLGDRHVEDGSLY